MRPRLRKSTFLREASSSTSARSSIGSSFAPAGHADSSHPSASMQLHQKTSILTKFNWLVLPQILLLLLLAIYLVGGAVVFTILDDSLAHRSLEDILLFEITTISTIGYGNIAPKTPAARLFCVVFAVLGIPLFLLAVGSLGKHLAKAYWHAVSAITGRKQLGALRGDAAGLPLPVALVSFALLVVAGSAMLRHTGQPTTVDNVYFSFISFSTVGFGDIVPVVRSGWQLAAVIAYLALGVALLSAVFTSLSTILRKLHHIGRRFRGARDVQVWMGGRSMPVSRLLEIVGKEFHASPREVREVLRDLDCLILAVVERQAAEREARARHSSAPDGVHAPLITELEDFASV